MPDIPPNITHTASQFTIFERLSLLELDILGKSQPKKPTLQRLSILEDSVFGEGSNKTGNLNDRLNLVLLSLRPSDELVAHLVQEKLTVPNWSTQRAKPCWLNTSFQLVSMVELNLLGKLNSGLLVDRVHSLEKTIWPDKTPPVDAALSDQIEMILEAIQPSSEFAKVAEEKLRKKGIIGNDDSALLKAVGKGIKKAGKSVKNYSQPVRGFLKSPTFWLALLGAGSVVGLAFASRGSSSTSRPLIYSNHACQGSQDCNKCTNCNDCIWCNNGGSPKCNKYAFRRL